MSLLDEASDEELWHKAGRHNGAAFGTLFTRHADAVYNHCFRRTGSWAAAEELTGIVFMEAWRRRWTAYTGGDTMLPWLLAVANNVIRNARRSQRRYQRLLAKLPPPAATADFGDETADRLDAEQAMQSILGLLHDLPLPEQEAIALCDWAGLSPTEAATAIGVPPGTLRSRLSRARQHLRLAAEGQDEAPRAASPLGCQSTKGTT